MFVPNFLQALGWIFGCVVKSLVLVAAFWNILTGIYTLTLCYAALIVTEKQTYVIGHSIADLSLTDPEASRLIVSMFTFLKQSLCSFSTLDFLCVM